MGAVQGDVLDPKQVDRFVEGCDMLIHLAAVAHTHLVGPAETVRAHAVNVGGTRNLIQAALRHGVRRFVFVSSVHVYRQQAGQDITENAARASDHSYARTKVEAEDLVFESGQAGLEVIVARPCLVYGAGAKFNLHALLRAIDKRYYVHFGGADPVRSFLSVTNAAGALIHLLDHGTAGEAYNIADPRPLHLSEFANALARRMQRPLPFTIPAFIMRPGLSLLQATNSLGLLTGIGDSVRKLTQPFSVSVAKLASTGFQWSEENDLEQMVDAYLKLAGDHSPTSRHAVAIRDTK
jgi:nucleoside-diphosphate-sugar epimerase